MKPTWRSIIFKWVIQMVSRGLLYYFIRKGMNPGNYGEKRKRNLENQLAGNGGREDYYGDAFYGGIASGLIFIIRTFTFIYLEGYL